MEQFVVELVQLLALNPEAAGLTILLALALGVLLKQTPKCPNWLIPWATAALGTISGYLQISNDFYGGAAGFCLGVFATGLHSAFKNGVAQARRKGA